MDRNYKGRFWYSKEVFLMVKAVWKWNRVIYYRRDWLRNNMADQPLGRPFELGFLKNDFNKMTTCRDMCRTGGPKKCDAPVVVAQLLSVVWLFATSWTAVRQASLSFTISRWWGDAQTCSNSCLLSGWCHPTISSSVVPFSSCLQSLPASGSFPMSQLFKSAKVLFLGTSRSQKTFPAFSMKVQKGPDLKLGPWKRNSQKEREFLESSRICQNWDNVVPPETINILPLLSHQLILLSSVPLIHQTQMKARVKRL